MSGAVQPSYNNVYERLVTDQQDLVGAVAYALYKHDKREFIKNRHLSTGDKGVTEYHHQVGDVALKAFRLAAESALSQHTARDVAVAYDHAYKAAAGELSNANKALASELIQTTKEVKGVAQELASSKAEVIKTINARTKFWMAVWAGVVGTFAFAVLLSLAIWLNKHQQNALGGVYQLLYEGTKDASPAPPPASSPKP